MCALGKREEDLLDIEIEFEADPKPDEVVSNQYSLVVT